MPHLLTDGADVLSRTTLMSIRRLLHARREGWLPQARLAAAARMAADDARRLGWPAQRLIVALKREWAALPEARLLSVLDGHDLLASLISLCIRAYYHPDAVSARGGEMQRGAA